MDWIYTGYVWSTTTAKKKVCGTCFGIPVMHTKVPYKIPVPGRDDVLFEVSVLHRY